MFCTFHFCSSHTLAAEDVQFVEPPSRDYFCPVTYEVMDQPHLTLCCGQHFSEETVTKLELCPFCKSKLSTVLNKHFQRQVKSLRVVCRHKGRGCEWQGEFSSLDNHTKSCPNRPPFHTFQREQRKLCKQIELVLLRKKLLMWVFQS